MWVLPNKKGFLKWVYNKYGSTIGDGRLNPHQELIRDYLDINTPYRGLLLYHGLGTGKTASSIAAAEGFLKKQFIDQDMHKNKKIIVLVSASLEMNYKKEIKKHATVNNPRYATWVGVTFEGLDSPEYSREEYNKLLERIYSRYFISPDVSSKIIMNTKGKIWLPYEYDLPDLEWSAGKITLEVEAVSWKNIDPEIRDNYITKLIDNIINERFTFLHYNSSYIISKITKMNIELNYNRTKIKWQLYKFNGKINSLPSDFNNNLKDDYGVNHSQIKSLNNKFGIESDFIYFYVPEMFIGYKHWTKYEEGDLTNWSDLVSPMLATDCYQLIMKNLPDIANKIVIKRTIFDNSCIIMDEAHNFMSSITRESKTRAPIYRQIMSARNPKIVLLSGTPIINYPFELSMMINLLRGPMELYRYIIPEDGIVPNTDDLEKSLAEVNVLKYMDFIMIKPNDGEIQFSLLPYGYVRGGSRAAVKSGFYIQNAEWEFTSDEIAKKVYKIFEDKTGEMKASTFYALPPTQVDFNDMFLDESDILNPKVINGEFFKRRILGTVSYFRSAGMAEINGPHVINVKMSKPQYKNYVEVRISEIKMEESKARKSRAKGPSSPLGSQNTVYRAFSRMACNFSFIQDLDNRGNNIQRRYPFNVRKGLKDEIASAADASTEPSNESEEVLEARTVAQGEEETSGGAGPGAAFTKEVSKRYQAELKALMKEVKNKSSEMLTPENLTKYFSPKFAEILKYIDTPGDNTSLGRSGYWKTLLYSDFRTVEGIGLQKIILEQADYIEIKIIKNPTTNEWTIDNYDKVFESKYNFKRFIEFTDNKEQAKYSIDLFNNNHSALPESIQAILKDKNHFSTYTNETPYADKEDKLRGDLVRIMMITKLASEGISLMNVRRVLITEPFWNMARIRQVIGRAIRLDSHENMKGEFNSRGWKLDVDVYIFLSVFNPQHLEASEDSKSNYTIQRIDGNKTTDENIYELAVKKSTVIDKFFGYLKSASIDCLNNASSNKESEACYSFPVNAKAEELSYEPNIRSDFDRFKMENRLLGERKIDNAKVVLERDMIRFKVTSSRLKLSEFGIGNRKEYPYDKYLAKDEELKIKYDELAEAIAEGKVLEIVFNKKYIGNITGYPDILFDYDAYKYGKVLTRVNL